MASKKYAYYNKGNKIAIIQKNTNEAYCSLSGYENKSDCEAAGGTWYSSGAFSGDTSTYGKYKSPTETVENGLEIEYTYAPIYNNNTVGQEGTDTFKFIGWGSNGTNLILFTYGATGVYNLSSLFAADNWILISGSGRWSGLHQVKSTGGTTGILTLKTKCRLNPAKITPEVTFSGSTASFSSGDADNIQMLNEFKDLTAYRDNKYIFIDAAADTVSNGFFKVTHSSSASDGGFTLDQKITIDANNDYQSAAATAASEDDDVIAVYNAFYEQMNVYKGLEVLTDESFELDLTRYQSNALIYYLRARMAEDIMNIELFEYYMAKFRKQLEKASDSRKYGPSMVQGFGMTR
tara:strand:- start:1155 stop:2201 length:1047 start_codon:yes stop_codon:yes gene_type:complete